MADGFTNRFPGGIRPHSEASFMPKITHMSKQAPEVEWDIAQDDADWEHRCVLLLPNIGLVSNRRLRLKRYLWRMAALLLLLASTGSWWWRTIQGRPHAAEAVAAQQKYGAVAPYDGRSAISSAGD